ncbi:MAG: RidA family protein [Pseudomonadota bacterium]|nr:RidA family protein [Pseudomonadota bacterium]
MNDFLKKRLLSLNIKRHLTTNLTVANYRPFVLSNNFVFISGQLSLTDSGIKYQGKIKKKIVLDKIKDAVEIATSNLLWNLNDSIIDNKKKIKKIKCCNIKGYFNCEDVFYDHSSLLNFSSNLIVRVLGQKEGEHSRSALGVSSLPMNSPVEIEGIFSLSS